MNNKNKKIIVKKWLEFANRDLQNAEILFRNKSYEGCVLHCHQALEKYLKGAILEIGKSIRKTHDLPALLNDTGFNFPKEILDFVQELNAYYQPSRYPDTALIDSLSYKRLIVSNFLKLSKTTIQWIKFQTRQKK